MKRGFFGFTSVKLNFLPITNDLFIERRNVLVKIKKFLVVITIKQLCSTYIGLK